MAARNRYRKWFGGLAVALLIASPIYVRPAPADSDGDLISDLEEGAFDLPSPRDTDEDGTPDYLDLDSDNDTIADIIEAGRSDIDLAPVNTDKTVNFNDHIPDYIDIDSDNDSIGDWDEAWPQGTVPWGATPVPTITAQMTLAQSDYASARALLADSERNPMVPASTTPAPDGIPDYQDQDSDGDRIPDYIETSRDIDPFTLPIDTDSDGLADFRDLDTDGDGNPDILEWDSDADYIPNFLDSADYDGPMGDWDKDYISNLEEGATYALSGTTGALVLQSGGRDTDGDGLPDFKDGDSDNDNLGDAYEKGNASLQAAPRRSRGAAWNPDYMIPDIDDDGSLDGRDPGNSSAGPSIWVLLSPGGGHFDRDWDDDGIPDGLEGAGDLNSNGMTDWSESGAAGKWDPDGDNKWAWDDADSDNDDVPDSVEAGLTESLPDGPGNIMGTNLTAKNFFKDQCPGDTTDPYKFDTDGGGMPDGLEDTNHNGCYEPDLGESDPNNPDDDAAFIDPDADGIDSQTETDLGLDPNDSDSDDDGFNDGQENGNRTVSVVRFDGSTIAQSGAGSLFEDIDSDHTINGLDSDSDGDGLADSLEGCFTASYLSTHPELFDGPDEVRDTAAHQDGTWWDGNPDFHFAPVNCSNTHFLLKDTDSGGVVDGLEDFSRDGVMNGNETNPLDPGDDLVSDSDGDTLSAQLEAKLGTSDMDRDSDDDGAPDVDEYRNYFTDPANADSDGDGVFDGTELGITLGAIVPANGEIGGTDLSKGIFTPDLDPTTTTNPLRMDSDEGGVWDGFEDFNRNGFYEPELGETDPNNPNDDGSGLDCDGDGIPDAGEINVIGPQLGLNPAQAAAMALDADYDDDGLPDGLEALNDVDDDGIPGLLDPDSDNDGLTDGLEAGMSGPVIPPNPSPPTCGAATGTNTGSPNFHADLDPTTQTSFLRPDTDNGGKMDGQEDLNHNGQIDASETDPNDPVDDTNANDRDGDGLSDNQELILYLTDPDDADSDDDGITDGREVLVTKTSPISADSDADGLLDGLELGLTSPDIVSATDASIFVKDMDPTTVTNPLKQDTDGGGRIDGTEDVNHNGLYQPGETNPLDPADDNDPIGPPAPDSDGDGLADFAEVSLGLNPNDSDSDDDGLLDGEENGSTNTSVTLKDFTVITVNSFSVGRDVDLDTIYNGYDQDADGDGLRDSVEACITIADLTANTARYNGPDGLIDTAAGNSPACAPPLQEGASCDGTWWQGNPNFIAAPDPCTQKTHFLLADTDRGGVNDGLEDTSHDGIKDIDETDPLDSTDDGGFGAVDTDKDGLNAQQEALTGTSDQDADSDDDGLTDGQEVLILLTNPLSPDSDGDGIYDGTEAGMFVPVAGGTGYTGTDVAVGFFVADADPLSTTNPKSKDTDAGGKADGAEDSNRNGMIDADETDPNNAADDNAQQDCDGDGLSDILEVQLAAQFQLQFPGISQPLLEAMPLDADSDDDGLADGLESFSDTDNDNLPGLLDPDSDNDGLNDGLETGISNPVLPRTPVPAGCSASVGTFPTSPNFQKDIDPLTTTSRLVADTDGGSVVDGAEDANHNGKYEPGLGETDPRNALDDAGQGDSDGDGLADGYELVNGLNPHDVDTDDDGLSDGREVITLHTNAANRDTDSDGVQDGTEKGLVNPDYPPDTNLAIFIPDADPATKTNPLNSDTDNGGKIDGLEDLSHNGKIDPGESNPLDPADDNGPVIDPNKDTDGDGIVDILETPDVLGTDPRRADSDGDGIGDLIEIGGATVLNPASPDYLLPPDTDGDNLIDALDQDSDNDAVPDGTEDRNKDGILDPDETDRLSDDSDGDGVKDLVEIGGPTQLSAAAWADTDKDGRIDARDSDSDNDGIPDGYEDLNADGILNANETNSLSPDTDKDGVADLIEAVCDQTQADAGAASQCIGLKSALDTLHTTSPYGVLPGFSLIDLYKPAKNLIVLPDSDGDGLIDAQDSDADNDDLPDGTEDRNADGILDAGETSRLMADTDSGGIVDKQEIADGTNPQNPADDGLTLSGGCATGTGDPALVLFMLLVTGGALHRMFNRGMKRREARPLT